MSASIVNGAAIPTRFGGWLGDGGGRLLSSLGKPRSAQVAPGLSHLGKGIQGWAGWTPWSRQVYVYGRYPYWSIALKTKSLVTRLPGLRKQLETAAEHSACILLESCLDRRPRSLQVRDALGLSGPPIPRYPSSENSTLEFRVRKVRIALSQSRLLRGGWVIALCAENCQLHATENSPNCKLITTLQEKWVSYL